jgi:acetyl esterase
LKLVFIIPKWRSYFPAVYKLMRELIQVFFFYSSFQHTKKTMSKTPIHPFYKQECIRAAGQSPILLKVLANAMETKDYSQIQAFRAAGDEQLSKIPLPDIIKTTKEVIGGPEGIKLKLVIYRPVGSEDEVLPIILFFHGGGYIFGSIYTHGKPVIDVICLF